VKLRLKPDGDVFLYDISAFHPGTYLGVALLPAVTAVVASGVPAVRATRIDPMESLRVE
jgi:ABC-type lipoprotein release transport system permease subunit